MKEENNSQTSESDAVTEEKDLSESNGEEQFAPEHALTQKKKVFVLIAVIAAMLLTSFTWLTLRTDDSTTDIAQITSYEECVAAGNPVMESFPEQCATSSGEVFVNERADINGTEVTTEAVFDSNTIAITHPSTWRVVEQESDEVPGRKTISLSHPEYGVVALSNTGGIGYRCYYSDYGLDIESYDENGDLIEYKFQQPFTARYTLLDTISTQTADLTFNRYSVDTIDATLLDEPNTYNLSETLNKLDDYYVAVGPDTQYLESYDGLADLEVGEVYIHEYSTDERCYPFEGPNAIFTDNGAFINVEVAEYTEENADGIGYFPKNNLPAEFMNNEIRAILSSVQIQY